MGQSCIRACLQPFHYLWYVVLKQNSWVSWQGTLEGWVGRQYDDSTELRRKSATSHVARMTSGTLPLSRLGGNFILGTRV